MATSDTAQLQTLVLRCRDLFQNLSGHAVSSDIPDGHESQMFARSFALGASILNESQRFEAWYRDLGAHQSGRASLAHRLREVPKVRKLANKYLQDLWQVLSLAESFQIHLLSLSEKLPEVQDDSMEEHRDLLLKEAEEKLSQIQMPPEATETKSDARQSDNSSGDVLAGSLTDKPFPEMLVTNITSIVDRLFLISFKIRHASTRRKHSKAAFIREVDLANCQDDLVAQRDSLYVRELIRDLRRKPLGEASQVVPDPVAPNRQGDADELDKEYLVRRIIDAVALRRRQFSYWQRHQEKLSAETAPDHGGFDDSASAVRSALAHSVATSATKLEEANVNFDDVRSTSSLRTVAIRRRESDRDEVDFPPDRQIEPGQKEFPCPFCRVMQPSSIAKGDQWRTHVLRDAQPYVCTFDNCSDQDHIFASFHEWLGHEIEAHKLGDPALRLSIRSIALATEYARRDCPICLKPDESPAHIASHLERIALHALPEDPQAKTEDPESEASSTSMSKGGFQDLPLGDRPFVCKHPDCQSADGKPPKGYIRKADLARHVHEKHGQKYIDCPQENCVRKGDQGFVRMRRLLEHLRKFHKIDRSTEELDKTIQWPKTSDCQEPSVRTIKLEDASGVVVKIACLESQDIDRNQISVDCARRLGYLLADHPDSTSNVHTSTKITWAVPGCAVTFHDVFDIIDSAGNFDVILGADSVEKISWMERGPASL